MAVDPADDYRLLPNFSRSPRRRRVSASTLSRWRRVAAATLSAVPTVLFTCAGQRVDIVSAFGRAGATTLAVDVNALAPALYHADSFALVPRVDDDRYVPALRDLVAAHDVSLVVPLTDLDQGLLASCFVTPTRQVEAGELQVLYRDRYAGDEFVEVVGSPPGVRDVRETNVCRVHAALSPDGDRVLAFAAIDNLWKGAAGQAVQNLNLMLGLAESEGLR